MYFQYEAAKAIAEDALRYAEQRREISRLRRQARQATTVETFTEAEVVELAFGAQGESDRIGA